MLEEYARVPMEKALKFMKSTMKVIIIISDQTLNRFNLKIFLFTKVILFKFKKKTAAQPFLECSTGTYYISPL